jgi:hypothetical protein
MEIAIPEFDHIYTNTFIPKTSGMGLLGHSLLNVDRIEDRGLIVERASRMM